jgi:hypothetical protein
MNALCDHCGWVVYVVYIAIAALILALMAWIPKIEEWLHEEHIRYREAKWKEHLLDQIDFLESEPFLTEAQKNELLRLQLIRDGK